jgi:glycosyltransferase involved in cell wall biosynthesis
VTNLLVGIPALNEAATIADVIGRIPRDMKGVSRVDVVVVDDGSTDDTGKLAKEAGAAVIRHTVNSGVGRAFQSLTRYAIEHRADILTTIDADGQFNPAHIEELITPILEGRALVSTASRFLDEKLVPQMPAIKKWGNHRVANLVSMLSGQKFADVSCGFRAYSREALLRLTVYHSFTYTHETFLDLAAKHVPIVEIPLEVRGVREHGQSRVASSVLRYGWRTALIMLRTYRDHQPLRFCGYIAALLTLMAVGFLVGSFLHWQASGAWLKWAALTGAALVALAILTLFFGFMADMFTRFRRNQEEILYRLRAQAVPPSTEESDREEGEGEPP